MPYENVTAHEWERTALYFAVGMLLIVTAAIFLFAINRIVGGNPLVCPCCCGARGAGQLAHENVRVPLQTVRRGIRDIACDEFRKSAGRR